MTLNFLRNLINNLVNRVELLEQGAPGGPHASGDIGAVQVAATGSTFTNDEGFFYYDKVKHQRLSIWSGVRGRLDKP